LHSKARRAHSGSSLPGSDSDLSVQSACDLIDLASGSRKISLAEPSNLSSVGVASTDEWKGLGKDLEGGPSLTSQNLGNLNNNSGPDRNATRSQSNVLLRPIPSGDIGSQSTTSDASNDSKTKLNPKNNTLQGVTSVPTLSSTINSSQ
ncbi:hypothetical protein SARC_14623, partial [Sphaeroforma arctica JP610]